MPQKKQVQHPQKTAPASLAKPIVYASSPTDFDQVALFNQLFANIVERSRQRSIAEILDYILQDGGVEMDNKALMEKANMLGMRMELHTPQPNEGKQSVDSVTPGIASDLPNDNKVV